MIEVIEEDKMSGESESDDGLCDYERLRLENIRKNHSMLRSLGWPLSLSLSLSLSLAHTHTHFGLVLFYRVVTACKAKASSSQ